MNAATWTPARHRYTVEDYYRQAEAGILPPDARTELIYGEIFDMTPPGSRHTTVVNRLTRIFSARLTGRAILQVQSPIRLDQYSQPQPDLALLKPASHEYWDALPGASDVLLLIEVGDSTAAWDRRVKAGLYARAGVAELWLIDLYARTATVCRDPHGEGYRDVSSIAVDAALQTLAFSDLVISLGEVL